MAPLPSPTSKALLMPIVDEQLMTLSRSSRQWTSALLKALLRIPKHQPGAIFVCPGSMKCNVTDMCWSLIMRCTGGRIDFYSDLRSCHNAGSDASPPEVDLLCQSLTINHKKTTLPRDKKIYWSHLLGAVR